MSVPNLRNLGQFCVYLSSGQGLVSMSIVTVTLTFDLKIDRDHVHPETHVCAKFDKPRSVLCLVIIWTRSGLYVNMSKVTLTLTVDIKINWDHLHPKTHVCAKFEESRSILCLIIVRTRFGLYQYVDDHCGWLVVLGFNATLTAKVIS